MEGKTEGDNSVIRSEDKISSISIFRMDSLRIMVLLVLGITITQNIIRSWIYKVNVFGGKTSLPTEGNNAYQVEFCPQ